MEINVVYSIGSRCDTEKILKRLDLIKFSSIFGSMYIRYYNKLIKCFDSNFNILFDESNLIYSKDIATMSAENNHYGLRTLNKLLDDVNDFHSATIAHHDLSNTEHKNHFLRGINRLNYIRNQNIPILFVYISSWEYDNPEDNSYLVNSIIKSGFNNMKILSIYITNEVFEPQIVYTSEHMIVYKINNMNDDIIKGIIQKHFNCENLLDINYFPNDVVLNNHTITN